MNNNPDVLVGYPKQIKESLDSKKLLSKYIAIPIFITKSLYVYTKVADEISALKA